MCYTLTMSTIKTIIFDVGGVITFTDFEAVYKNYGQRIGLDPQKITEYHKQNWPDLILGNINLEQFFDALKGSIVKDRSSLEVIWLEEVLKARQINEELLNIILNLRKKYEVGVLSNLTWARQISDEQMHLYDNFDFVILSCQEHIKKTGPGILRFSFKKSRRRTCRSNFCGWYGKEHLSRQSAGLKRDFIYR